MDIFKPAQQLSDLVVYGLLHFSPRSYLGSAVNFFIYDSIKIGILLVVVNFIMAILRHYFPMEKTKNILVKRHWFGADYLLAALLGVVTPFCSCSSIPLFIGFLSAGIPLGVTFSFLISSPLVNESSIYLFPAMFGIKTTIAYNVIGIVFAMVGGYIIQKLGMEKYVKKGFINIKSKRITVAGNENEMKFWNHLKYFWDEGLNITKSIFPYVLLGVGIGAVIHGFVPDTFVEKYLSERRWWSVPAATLLGAPLYANSVGIIPIMEALVKKGVPLGTTLAFMTSIVTISIPEFLILRKVMKWQLLVTFFSITLLGAMLIGYLFNIFS